MELRAASVDWREDVGNDPRLQVVVDEIPTRDDLRFQQEDGLWFGIKDGYVIYYSWSGDGNDGGFSGQGFTVTMRDGEEVVLRGPGASRAGIVNQRSFGPVVDIRITTEMSVLERGYTFRTGALTLEAAKQVIDLVDEDCHLERRVKFSSQEPYWIPTRDGGGEP